MHACAGSGLVESSNIGGGVRVGVGGLGLLCVVGLAFWV